MVLAARRCTGSRRGLCPAVRWGRFGAERSARGRTGGRHQFLWETVDASARRIVCAVWATPPLEVRERRGSGIGPRSGPRMVPCTRTGRPTHTAPSGHRRTLVSPRGCCTRSTPTVSETRSAPSRCGLHRVTHCGPDPCQLPPCMQRPRRNTRSSDIAEFFGGGCRRSRSNRVPAPLCCFATNQWAPPSCAATTTQHGAVVATPFFR